MEIVQAVKKLKFNLASATELSEMTVLCTILYRNLMQASNFGDILTNFSFEFFYAIFTQDAPLLFLYPGAKKSKMTKNSNQEEGGGGPALTQAALELQFRRISDLTHSICLHKANRIKDCRGPSFADDCKLSFLH